MKTIIFRGELNPESAQNLINDIEQPHEEFRETDIKILFSSMGGQMDMAQAVIDCINGLPKEFKVEFIVSYQVNSCAFNIFVKINCKKRLYEGSNAVVHLFERIVSSKDIIHNKDSYDRFLVDLADDENVKYLEWLESLGVFKRKELKKIARGGDVYVEGERLQKIIDNQNKKKQEKSKKKTKGKEGNSRSG